MLDDTAVEAFNTRATYSVNDLKKLTTEQQDRVKASGTAAEALLKNRDLALFFHTAKFDITDRLAAIKNHTPEDNNLRIALGNQLSGLNTFIDTLRNAVYLKTQLVRSNQPPTDTI